MECRAHHLPGRTHKADTGPGLIVGYLPAQSCQCSLGIPHIVPGGSSLIQITGQLPRLPHLDYGFAFLPVLGPRQFLFI